MIAFFEIHCIIYFCIFGGGLLVIFSVMIAGNISEINVLMIKTTAFTYPTFIPKGSNFVNALYDVFFYLQIFVVSLGRFTVE